jgi:hypothetical protein
MEADIEMIVSLAECSREDAVAALETHKTVFESVSALLVVPATKGAPLRRQRDKVQQEFDNLRKKMEDITQSIEDGLQKKNPTCEGQHEFVESVEMPCLPEETVQQKSCSLECHPPSPELEAQKQETAYQLQ